MQILTCRPEHYAVVYSINPWMNPQTNNADTQLANEQWQTLTDLIRSTGNEVVEIDPAPGWPDMVFTANAGLIKDKKVVLSNFTHPERNGEEPYFKRWFEDNGYEVLEVEETFEGAGDSLFFGDVLFAGHGFRTEKCVYEKIKEFLDIEIIVLSHLIDPYFYHLDTCFCPLNDELALILPAAFDPWMVEEVGIFTDIKLRSVPSDEAKNFACNAVVLADTVIIPSDCPETRRILEMEGFHVLDCPMTEFLKAGGACKCLTLKL